MNQEMVNEIIKTVGVNPKQIADLMSSNFKRDINVLFESVKNGAVHCYDVTIEDNPKSFSVFLNDDVLQIDVCDELQTEYDKLTAAPIAEMVSKHFDMDIKKAEEIVSFINSI